MKQARMRVLTIVIAVSLVFMLMLPLLAQNFNNPLLNVGAIAQTHQSGFGGTAQATVGGTPMTTPLATVTPNATLST